ncbi:hypothetical protein Scep_012407 [Stephania cephalantha]|uniref:Uncharacterized protein n=1 Tax=Stephania cephalantha TaxID=152367 RepID=A0AAP0P7G9_9MAGN
MTKEGFAEVVERSGATASERVCDSGGTVLDDERRKQSEWAADESERDLQIATAEQRVREAMASASSVRQSGVGVLAAVDVQRRRWMRQTDIDAGVVQAPTEASQQTRQKNKRKDPRLGL